MFKKKRKIFTGFASAGVLLLGMFLGTPLFAESENRYMPEPPAAWEVDAEREIFAEVDRAREKATDQETPFTARDYQKIKEEVQPEHEQLAMESDLFEERMADRDRPIFQKKPPLLLAHTPMDSPALRAGGGSGGSAVVPGTLCLATGTITQKYKRASQTTAEQPTVRNENRAIQNYYSIKNGYIWGKRREFTRNSATVPLIAHQRALKPVISADSPKNLIKKSLPNVLTGKTGPLV